MKWIFYVIVFIYMFYRAVYGVKTIHKETSGILIENMDYGEGKTYIEAGVRKTVACNATSKNQKVEWVDPSNKIIERVTSNRVFAKENFFPHLRNRIPSSVLTFAQTSVNDTGIWKCRSGDLIKEIPLCIIESSEFVNTPTEVTVERGRSITLTCQARGNPEPRLSWYRNEKIITDQNLDSKYHVMTKFNSQGFESLLTITALQPEDSGEYICDAIQENSVLEDCTDSTYFNITVHVKYAPILEDGEDISYVAGLENESIDLVCAAKGYPEPTYKFLEIGDSQDIEIAKDEISYDDGKAIFTITTNNSIFEQKYYRCQASNLFGEVKKMFVVKKLETPKKPVEVILENATHDALHLKIQWNNETFYIVDEVTLQYLELETLLKKKNAIPKEKDWRTANEETLKTGSDQHFIDPEDLIVILPDLKEETQYWVRIKATNRAGTSPWSNPALYSTNTKPEIVKVMELEESLLKPEVKQIAIAQTSEVFYGIIFTGGVIVVAVGCMLIVRKL